MDQNRQKLWKIRKIAKNSVLGPKPIYMIMPIFPDLFKENQFCFRVLSRGPPLTITGLKN